jgi:hypothetical protein
MNGPFPGRVEAKTLMTEEGASAWLVPGAPWPGRPVLGTPFGSWLNGSVIVLAPML